LGSETDKGPTMKPLLSATAVIEVGAGLALLVLPSAVVWLLLGAALETPAGLTVARVAGGGLLSLGVACWFARQDGGRPVTGLVRAMLLYNIVAVAILAGAGISSEVVGVALWPAVVLHTAMAVWCVACLGNQRVNQGNGKWERTCEPPVRHG